MLRDTRVLRGGKAKGRRASRDGAAVAVLQHFEHSISAMLASTASSVSWSMAGRAASRCLVGPTTGVGMLLQSLCKRPFRNELGGRKELVSGHLLVRSPVYEA